MGKPDKNSAPRTCDGMSQEQMIRDLWNAHYGPSGSMIRLDRVERKVHFAQWIGSTALAGAIAGFVDWSLRKMGVHA